VEVIVVEALLLYLRQSARPSSDALPELPFYVRTLPASIRPHGKNPAFSSVRREA
jgi:hypothetical protein